MKKDERRFEHGNIGCGGVLSRRRRAELSLPTTSSTGPSEDLGMSVRAGSMQGVCRPSKSTVKAAKAAATSSHGLINLVRLVHALGSTSQDLDESADAHSAVAERRDAEVGLLHGYQRSSAELHARPFNTQD